jgi:dipeptidyl aminopeptidase/acylaminoacyl peptidase
MPPTKKFLKPLVVLSALVLFLALPAAASATIAFVRGFANQSVYTAGNDGSGVKKIAAKGADPHVSPDGGSVVYDAEGPGHKPEMKIVPAGGGAAKTLMTNWQEPFNLVFSPDSEFILATRGGELGKRKLVLITVATGAQKVLATGFFSGFSFDPEGKEIVFGMSQSEKFPPKANVYKVSAAGGKPVALTHDNRSEFPLWGPTGKIVFVKLLEASKRKYAPKNELFLMNENGKGVKRLTHTKVGQLLQGLFPTAWSANGKRLLAQFGGQDTTYAVGVNAQTGAQKPIIEATEQGLIGTALSPDGKTVYGSTGGFEGAQNGKVVRVPWSGGKPKVLTKGMLPSFSF